ncbi:MAG: archaemetzincin family Zn-dependent metalloprotease [Candidatus Aminicenantes bacterium]
MSVPGFSSHPGTKIHVVPLDDIKDWVLGEVSSHLDETFHCRVEISPPMKIPPDAYHPQRKQFFSSRILNALHRSLSAHQKGKVLALADVDLYVPSLNFVFGEAELGGKFAVISLSRLRQSFYGLPENRTLFLERTVKEAVHELGHTFGLRHCPNQECVMHFSNSLSDTDRKSPSFCSRCQRLLEKFQREK